MVEKENNRPHTTAQGYFQIGQKQKEKERKKKDIRAFTHSVDIEADRFLSLQQNDDPSFPSANFISQRYGYGDQLILLTETSVTHHVRDETKVTHHRHFVVHYQGQQRYTRL